MTNYLLLFSFHAINNKLLMFIVDGLEGGEEQGEVGGGGGTSK